MLHDRAACLVAERIGRQERALEVEQVVERELLAAALHEVRQPGTATLHVERRALVGILAVA
jgi:hypothetical protein